MTGVIVVVSNSNLVDSNTAYNIGLLKSEFRRIGLRAGSVTIAGVTSPKAYKVPRMGIKGGGNVMTATWRIRRGGAWCSPLNKKFKA